MSTERLYLTYDWSDDHNAYLAVVTAGHPRYDDDGCTVLDVELLPSPRACRQWFKRVRKEKPWEQEE